ncbi:MAG: amidohydrolase family protein [Chloroflexi bacterium]|nr:amidohydrolase family protein [Chloroflexota bacterium]
MKGAAQSYHDLLDYCQSIYIIDCHDHAMHTGPKYTDPVQVVVGEYFHTDLASATSAEEAQLLLDDTVAWEKRWPILEKAWARTKHTGYAQVTRRVLRRFYEEDGLSFEALQRMQERLPDLSDVDAYDAVLEEAKILLRIEDVWPDTGEILAGTYTPTPRGKVVISLPDLHAIRSYASVQEIVAPLGRTVSTLDEYLNACREIFEGFKSYGAVAFKDQSAYTRALDYGNPTRAEAEAVFNWFMADPLRNASYPQQTRPLDDYLFNTFMRMARDMDLPVQIHTGHLAGLWGDIRGANAVQMADFFLRHRQTRFDLFHANWPYSGEALYLCKNFPNVMVDFCWTNMLDPIYCQNMYRQALSSVPHGKIFGFGSDLGAHGFYGHSGYPDRAWAHAQIARENIAIALSDMVEIGYLGLDEAKEVAYGWLFANPNAFYRLGL